MLYVGLKNRAWAEQVERVNKLRLFEGKIEIERPEEKKSALI